ncbi:MAG: Mu-like prophage FluMu N-terminal domain [Pseudomonadota bacterium]|jgi:hypothetical protein
MAIRALRITARRDGFRRAGIAHPAGAVEHPLDTLTTAQIAALRAESMLIVEDIAEDEAGAVAPGRKKGGAA